jgi:hypothetical protein
MDVIKPLREHSAAKATVDHGACPRLPRGFMFTGSFGNQGVPEVSRMGLPPGVHDGVPADELTSNPNQIHQEKIHRAVIGMTEKCKESGWQPCSDQPLVPRLHLHADVLLPAPAGSVTERAPSRQTSQPPVDSKLPPQTARAGAYLPPRHVAPGHEVCIDVSPLPPSVGWSNRPRPGTSALGKMLIRSSNLQQEPDAVAYKPVAACTTAATMKRVQKAYDGRDHETAPSTTATATVRPTTSGSSAIAKAAAKHVLARPSRRNHQRDREAATLVPPMQALNGNRNIACIRKG